MGCVARAIDGSPLAGGRIVRFIYSDEAGISRNEPVTVVAGVVVDADAEWERLEAAIGALRQRVPEEFREGFIFHAEELFGGGKYRSKWPKEERWALLEDLVAIPRKHYAGVAFGYEFRGNKASLESNPDRLFKLEHIYAFANCLVAAAEYLRDHTRPGEVAIVVAENTNDMKSTLQKMTEVLKAQSAANAFVGGAPVSRIKDVPHFCAKDQAILLQLADACAFTVRRFLAGQKDAKRFYRAFRGASTPPIIETPGSKSGRIYIHWQLLSKTPAK